MCTTIDGKILTNRWPRVAGAKSGASLFETTAASFKVPAWVVGTTTMKEFSAPAGTKLEKAPRPIANTDHVASAGAKSFAIGADANAVLRFKKNDVEGDHVILLITGKASSAYLAHLQAVGVSYLFCGKAKIDLAVAMSKLRKLFGIKKLMLEGGGLFNGSTLHAGLVDEISQLILPIADGGGGAVASIFDHDGPVPAKSAATLKLISHRSMPGGVQWLRYRVVRYHNG